MRKKPTPIEFVFCDNHNSPNYDHSTPHYLKERIVVFCENYKITTAEQLAAISEESFRKMAYNMGIQIGRIKEKYVFNRMREFGFPMSKKKFENISAYETIGENALKDYLVAAMTDVARSKRKILFDAKCNLSDSLLSHLLEQKEQTQLTSFDPSSISKYTDREFREYNEQKIEKFVSNAFYNPKTALLFDELVKEGRVLARPQEIKSDSLGYFIAKGVRK